MAYLDGTIIRCDGDCKCGGRHQKMAVLEGTSLVIQGRIGGRMPHKVQVSVFDLLKLVGTVR